MADLSHLEKMGRELKCPICLSLLMSAVSLACNHVFCNLCIVESMKSVSDCPVCKVPFHRRDVRPAPHMDNLVAVFKNMEVAAGVNIFTTQVGPSTRNPGDVEKNSSLKESALACRGRPKKKVSVHKMRQKSEKIDVKTSDSCQQEKPSFPVKKRIHVTPYPVSETPVPPKKVSKLTNTSNELETSRSLNEDKRIAAEGHEGTLFTPFFWLREENEEEDDEASGKPSSQPTADTSDTHFAPCFSDIKDSEDDKSPSKTTATSQFDAAGAFDSEIFEWTQRACSPELCSTPLKKQTSGRNTLDTIQEKYCPKQTETLFNSEIPHDDSMKRTKTVQTNMNDKRNGSLLAKKGRRTEKKRPARTRGKHLKKCTISHDSLLGEVNPEIAFDIAERGKASSQEDEDAGQKELSSCGRRIGKRSKKPTKNYQMENNADVAEVSTQAPTLSNTQEIQNENAEFMGILLPVLKSCTTKNEVELNVQNKIRAKGKQTAKRPNKKHMKLSTDYAMTKTLDEIPDNVITEAKTQNYKYETSIGGKSSKPSENKEVAENCSHRKAPEIQKVVRESRGKRKRKIQTVEPVVYTNDPEVNVASHENNGGKTNQADSLADKDLPSSKQVSSYNREKIFRKCGNIHSQIICAFCQSSNTTKDSGEMMHYFNGKLVAADYNGGANVIHSHKNCTEWAPDVYFEDDLAINLEVELARSRRIKCSCCGIKGAALGCYEKSCRKSFHFTCAKLIPECRWDNDNFVMLCPIHPSSKLPKESPERVKQRRKKANPKGELRTPNPCKNGHDMRQKWKWPSGSPCKWVLCCSALTSIEKGIISEFTRLTGVSVSKTWNAAVTHVIASTDDNGACRRTLKFLMGILDGKWILSMEWIKECLRAMEPVDEGKFEITVDVHGISGGPRQGRLRAIKKDPKLFDNVRFYLAGDFTTLYKGYLQDLIAAAGGTVLHRKPLAKDQDKLFHSSSALETFIVYSVDVPEKQKSGKGVDLSSRRAEAQALADECGAKVATSSWIIESIAAFKWQLLT